MVKVSEPRPSASEIMRMMAKWIGSIYGLKITIRLEGLGEDETISSDCRPAPLDVCTDPNNCKRCKAPTWEKHKHHHAGLTVDSKPSTIPYEIVPRSVPRRVWVNQPSTSQKYHCLHGMRCLAVEEIGGSTRVYFLNGALVSQLIDPMALSEGWPASSKVSIFEEDEPSTSPQGCVSGGCEVHCGDIKCRKD